MQNMFREPQSAPIRAMYLLVGYWGAREKIDLLENVLCIQQYHRVKKATLSGTLNLPTFRSLCHSFGMKERLKDCQKPIHWLGGIKEV